MRLFIAIDIPNDLKRSLERLQVKIPGLRWVPSIQIHLTLAFLGEVDEPVITELTGAAASIRLPSFDLRPAGIGCFPDQRHPRVVWLGVTPEPKLTALDAAVRAAVCSCNILQEERSFSPHLTLARLKQPPDKAFLTFLEQHRQLELPPFSVQEFTLFQSHLTAQGAIHTPLKTFRLAPAKGGDKR